MHTPLHQRLASTQGAYERFAKAATSGVFLYGAGFIGRWAVGYFEANGIPVNGFLDSNERKWGSTVAGKPVIGPEDPRVAEASAIVITSRHAVPSIEKTLAHMDACVMSVDAYVVHRFGREGIESIESLLGHDDHSVQTLRAVICSMLDGNRGALAPVADSRPFFGKFEFFNRDGEVFVDAGAYVGDTVERFVWSVNGVFKHIYAFEPGDLQYKAMQIRVERLCSEWAIDPAHVTLNNKALTDRDGVARLATDGPLTQSGLRDCGATSGVGGSHVEAVAIDSYFIDTRFSLLKVDVEGSERDLLNGGAVSIVKYRPRIALSVYHYPVDIFELPMWVNGISSDYTFTLGHHSSELMETVLYCVDQNE